MACCSPAPFDADRLEVTGPSVALIEGVASGVFGAGKFAISESGTLVYQPGSASAGSIALVKRDGAETLVESDQDVSDPRLSPDGSRVVFGSGGDIWILYLESGTTSRFTFEGDNGYPGWTPDGAKVTFFSTRVGEQNLYWKPADGSAPEDPIFTLDGKQNEITFSADGEWIVYRQGDRAFAENTDLIYTDSQLEEHRPFLATPFIERSPQLSPNGRWVAYVSNESGRDEVYVRAFPGPGGVWQISTGGGIEPMWAHSGRELFYRSGEGLVAVQVQAGATFAVGSREVLFRTDAYRSNVNHTAYDVSADDETFVFVKSAVSNELVVVLNWFEELKERVGGEQ